MSARAHSRRRSLSSQRPLQPQSQQQQQSYNYKSKEIVSVPPFEPCAATGSLFLYAIGSAIVCLHHDTLALERRFEKHTEAIQFICVDNISERGQGRLVVTYDVGRTAIVWDLMTGDQISRFASYEPLTAAAWMRNGNLTFGNEKGELILFEPASSEHVSARTIFDPVTAIAPSADCRTFAIGYRNGSILLASLQPTFTILHTLSTSRAPSQISALTWHASSSKQKSDMLATNTVDGDLRVWSVAKPPGSAQPRVIRSLHRSDAFNTSRSWISWSKNGRILQFYEGVTWSWDVRTKDLSYLPIPTVENIRGIAAYGPTGTLFTLGPENTIQQYDIDTAQMVANVRYLPNIVPQTPPQAVNSIMPGSGGESEFAAPYRELRYGTPDQSINIGQSTPNHRAHRRSQSHDSQPSDLRSYDVVSPPPKTEKSVTTISMGIPAELAAQIYSPSSTKSGRKISRLRQEVLASPEEKPVLDLFPFTRARLSDVPYPQPRTADGANRTSEDLRRQMLNVVFGWQDDIRALIRDELERHPNNTPNAVYLGRWLGADPNRVADVLRSTNTDLGLDWMRFALNTIGNEPGTKKMAQVFAQKLLSRNDVHAAASLLMSIGEYNDAIEIYVSRNFHMEAILLACLLTPSDWQRQSHLVRRWGEHVVSQSQQPLALRCFSCTNVESTETWTSPTAQFAAQGLKDGAADGVTMLQPSIYHKTMERRGVQDPSPQSYTAPTSLPSAGSGMSRPAAQDGLKLVTTFGSKDNFRFPGLMSDDCTPINAALVTPIAESALPRSAISPGGHASYKINNVRSLAGTLASRTGTPSSVHRNRLPSIGETPIEVEQSPFIASMIPRPPPTPADSGSDRERGLHIQAIQEKKSTQDDLPMLLTPARYDPRTPVVTETPQTAVAAQSHMTFASKTNSEIERPSSARPRGSSRTRKPDGLSVQTVAAPAFQTNQELLMPAVYGAAIQRPATASATYGANKSDISPPNTGNSLASLRSAKSPTSTSGRSLDKYISSLEQAQFYKSSRSRGNSINSKPSRDELGDRRHRYATRELESSIDSTGEMPIPMAKRSPSSPVPMSPGELRLHSVSVDSLDSAYLSTHSQNLRKDYDYGNSDSQRERSFLQEKRQRHRSRSRADGKTNGTSRNQSRRRSPDREPGKRGRSSSRKDDPAARSPESPVPMIPSEEDLLTVQNMDPALKIVAQNRQRLHRSSSRRDSSVDRKTMRMRSRSRQPEPIDTGLTRKGSLSGRGEQPHTQELMVGPRQIESAGIGIERLLGTPDGERKSLRSLQHLSHGRRKELAQAELEARRLSLTRRPSAPAVPLPGQHVSSSLALEYAPPLIRASTDQGAITLSQLGSPHPSRPESAGFGRSRPQTPRAMKHPAHGQKSIPDLPKFGEMLASSSHQTPSLPDTRVMSPRRRRTSSFTSPEIPFDMPKHPAFDANIATSRPGSSNANTYGRPKSPPRVLPMDRRAMAESRTDFQVMTIGEEEHSDAEVLYISPPVVPELQHLAMPPPPPPPPEPPQESPTHNYVPGLRIQTDNLSSAITIPLPQSAYPSDPMTAISPSEYHRRERSVNDRQIVGKIRHFAGRMRSTSRGRSQSRSRSDNPARSPNIGGDENTSPYESISQSAQQAQFQLAPVAEQR